MHIMVAVVMAIAARAAISSNPRGRKIVSILELPRPLGSSVGIGDETRGSKHFVNNNVLVYKF